MAFTSKASRICWRKGGVKAAMPALLTRISSFPWFRSTVVAACLIVSSLVTSRGMNSAEPAGFRDCNCLMASLPFSVDRDPTKTW